MPATTKKQGASKKQLYIIIGGSVVLGLLLAIQLPKLLGGGSETAAPTTTDALPTAGTTGTPGTSGAVNASGSGAVLAGVKIVPGVEVEPGEGQLASFSLFQNRDPFVQVVKDTGAAGSQDGEPVGVKVSGGGGAAAGAGGPKAGNGNSGPIVSGGTPGAVAGPSALTTATIWVNGSDESVAVKKKFPKADPTFVLLSLKQKVAQIGVVGGAFTGGKAIALKMGQSLTLVNTATGARYTLRLLYTGSQPEQVQQFTTQATNG
jgi:hypothetical protein